MVEYRDSSLTSAPFETVRFNSDATAMQLDGLMAFINYDVRVRAENMVGPSDPSNTLSSRTHPAGKINQIVATLVAQHLMFMVIPLSVAGYQVSSCIYICGSHR